ncbi:MAG: hypothetical protein JWL76_1128 [Thermoleophilia bacterium]|nr:hypothetical protein [Thermoleophilia bacterium]
MAKVLGTVEQLSTRGSSLADATVPRFFNGAEIGALSAEASSIGAAAKEAVELLGDDPVELLIKDRLAVVQKAASLVDSASSPRPSIDHIHRAGQTIRNTLRSTAGDVRGSISNDTERVLTELRGVQPRSLGASAIDELRSAIELRAALELPPLKLDARPLYPFDLPAGDAAAHVRLLQRPFAQQHGLLRDTDAVAARIEQLVGADPAQMSAIDAAELHVLVGAGADATWRLPRSIGERSLAEAVDVLSRGGDDALRAQFATAVTEHRAAIDATIPTANAATAAAVDAVPAAPSLRSLLDRDPATWSTQDWRAMETTLQSDAAAGSPLGIPRTIDGARSVERIVRDGIRGRDGAVQAMQRYVTAWDAIVPRSDAVVDPAAQRMVGEFAAIVSRDPSELQPRDWSRMRTLLDADPDGSILRGPRSLHNTQSLYRVLGTDGGRNAAAERGRYVEAWRTIVGPGAIAEDVRRQELHGLLRREPETLSRTEWSRMGALVDGAPAEMIDALQPTIHKPDLGGMARRHASERRSVEGSTRLAFARAALSIDDLVSDTARLHGAMRELVERAPGELGPNDWARMRALLELDSSRTVLDGPRYLMSAPSAEIIATSMMHGGDDMRLAARRLLGAWSAHMTGRWSSQERLLEAARGYASREPSSLSPAEWREVGTMIDVAGSTLRAPRHISGVDALEVTAARAAEGLPIAMPQTERAFRAWRLQFDPELSKPGALTNAVRSLVDRDPATLSVAEWRTLQTFIDFDAGWNTLGFASMPSGVASIADLVEAGVSRRPVDRGTWARIVDAWRLHADGVAADLPRLEAALYDAASPASGTFDEAALGRLRAVLDADARGGLLKAGRLGELFEPLREALSSRTPLTTDSTTIDLVRNRLLDGSQVTERRAQIRAAIDSGSFPKGVSLAEIREADARWLDRPPFEQLALEGQLGAFSGPKAFTMARDFLFRARDVQRPAEVPIPMSGLWDETRRLIDVNLERLAGHTRRGEVRGYSTHPDYAQVGRIQANVELLRRVIGGMHPATPPDQQVVRLGETRAAGAVGDALEW